MSSYTDEGESTVKTLSERYGKAMALWGYDWDAAKKQAEEDLREGAKSSRRDLKGLQSVLIDGDHSPQADKNTKDMLGELYKGVKRETEKKSKRTRKMA